MDKLAQFCNGFSCASIELWMHLRDLMRIQEAYVQSNVASNKSEACSSFSFRQPRSRPPLTRWKRGNDVIVSNLRSETIACEASVSVLFRSKGRAKNGASKRGGGGEERKETLADKPRDFENHPHRLSCLSGRTDI